MDIGEWIKAAVEIIIKGFKEFGGQIIGGILFAVALGLFPSLGSVK